MVEVFAHPESMQLWIDAGEGRPDWDLIFKDYQSMVDYPGAAFWKQIADHYPDAKVLHTGARPGQVVRTPPRPPSSRLAPSYAAGGRRRAARALLRQLHGPDARPPRRPRLHDRPLPPAHRGGEGGDRARAAAGLRGRRRLGPALRVPGRPRAGRALSVGELHRRLPGPGEGPGRPRQRRGARRTSREAARPSTARPAYRHGPPAGLEPATPRLEGGALSG